MNQPTDDEREPIPFVADTDRLLRLKDVADVLACSEGTVRTLIQTGELPAVRISEILLRVRQSDLNAWIASREAIKPTMVRQ